MAGEGPAIRQKGTTTMLRASIHSGSTTTSQRMRRLGSVAFLASITVLAHAGAASATGVPNHDHFLTTPGGDVVQVGPHVCANPEALHRAFHNFHDHVHTGAPTDIGNVRITPVFCN